MTTQSWIAPVYFDIDEVECLAEEEMTVPLTYTPPLILPAESQLEWQEVVEEKPVAFITQPKKTKTTLRQTYMSKSRISRQALVWLMGAVGVLLLLTLVVDTYHFIITQYEHSLFLGSIFLILCVIIVTTISFLSWHAYQNIRALRTVLALQQEGQRLIAVDGYGNATPYLQKIARFYIQRSDIKIRLEKFYIILNDSYHDSDVCRLFSNQVMSELDQEAYRIVVQRSKETAIMVMISPLALFDTIFTLWRNIVMIRDIATLYGGRPGFWASMSLTGTVLQNLVYADVSSLLADSLAETLGNSMLSVFSAQAAQGLGSGVMTARVGLKAIYTCRPLPFFDDEKPHLKEIRKEVVNSIKDIFENK